MDLVDLSSIVVPLGAGATTWAVFGKRGLAPALAATVVGYVYPEVTSLTLAAYLVIAFLRNRQQNYDSPPNEDDIIDAEFEVKNGV